MVKPQVIAGGYEAQALVENYKKSDIKHLVIKVFELQGDVELPVVDEAGNHVQVDLLNAELDVPLKFSNLFKTTYRIRCDAYRAPGVNPADRISVTEGSFTDVHIQSNNSPTVVALRVKLNDVPFIAGGTTSIEVTDGGIVRSGPVKVDKIRVDNVLVSTVAGSIRGWLDGPIASSRFDRPTSIAIGGDGTIFVSDAGNQGVRRLSASGDVSTVVNQIKSASSFELGMANGLAIGANGTFFLSLSNFNYLVSVTPGGILSTFSGTGQIGYVDGAKEAATYYQPVGIALDQSGNLFVADTYNHCIRKVNAVSGEVTTFAGNGVAGNVNGTGSSARFFHPTGITIDRFGNLFITDTNNHQIKRITPAGVVTTWAGRGDYGDEDGPAASARFDQPTGIAVDEQGNVFVADTSNNCIRKISATDGIVSTFAGSGREGAIDGGGNMAEFAQPSGICFDREGNLLICDTNNHRIRRVEIKK
jgi:streptogramin lyase